MKNKKFTNVLLFAYNYNKDIASTMINIYDNLKDAKISVYADENTLKNFSISAFKTQDYSEVEMIISVGGDGTMLQAAKLALRLDIAVIGINSGKLGFLTDISRQQLNFLIDILNGNNIFEQRSVITAEIIRNDENIKLGHAVNDIVINRSSALRVLDFNVEINDNFICNHKADGLVITTPTGSTAYALSAGGPILHPKVAALALVPICSHTLNTRPLVISDDDIVSLRINSSSINNAILSCDGNDAYQLQQTDQVIVRKYNKKLHIIHPAEHNYYDMLKNKLHWEKNPHVNLSPN